MARTFRFTIALVVVLAGSAWARPSEAAPAASPFVCQSAQDLVRPDEHAADADRKHQDQDRDRNDRDGRHKDDDKVLVCHRPPGDPDDYRTISIDRDALKAHLAHGDLLGACATQCAALCNDGNACTTDSGVWNAATARCSCSNAPVVCTASDQCHAAGTCNPSTGTCSNPPAANGTTCSDGNACTQTDTCQSGVCVGANPVTCTASDQCHVAGTCDPSTGTCSNPPAVNGTTCNDGNACTQTDTCQAGTCVGANPVNCTASDQCHIAGTCDPSTGTCSNPPAANGTSCSDGNACTQGDTCESGTCTGTTSTVCSLCSTLSPPTYGTCDSATGACTYNGGSCPPGNTCATPDLRAAITKQITSLDATDTPNLLVEITTLTAQPYELTETGVPTHPANLYPQPGATSSCTADNSDYRCVHDVQFKPGSGVCTWDGNYVMSLNYSCNPANTCGQCTQTESIAFSLQSENFCAQTFNTCSPTLSCSTATATPSLGGGGVPCCSTTYNPLVTCAANSCQSQCGASLLAGQGVDTSSACYSCLFANCHTQYFACAADTATCSGGN